MKHTISRSTPPTEHGVEGRSAYLRATTRPARGSGAVLHHREAQRLVAFLIAGGLSALVTLGVTSGLIEIAHTLFFWSALAGTELGILVNFSLNDRRAFHDLAGHRRSFPVRLLRYHMTCALGQSIILLSSVVLHNVVHWQAIFAQALPIAVVTGINFLMHRFWTYRGAPDSAQRGQEVSDGPAAISLHPAE